MFVATANSENNCGNFMTWLKVILGSYIADLLVGLNLLMQVQKTRKDNIYLMVFSYIILLFNTSWFCYGNYLYFNSSAGNITCNPPRD
jgi:hypothetical protein